MKHLVSKEGFLFVNRDFINGIVLAGELYIPDEYNYLDYYDEIPEQEALELQEKYNNNGIGILIKILGIPINKGTPNKDSNNEKSR